MGYIIGLESVLLFNLNEIYEFGKIILLGTYENKNEIGIFKTKKFY